MKPSIIAIDFETTGLDFWSPDFRALSCAFAWSSDDGRIKTRYLTGEDEIGRQLRIIEDAGIPLSCHNLSFELGVLIHRFPTFNRALLTVDTMRLVQVYDNGGKDVKTPQAMSLEDELAMLEGDLKTKSGLGLESAVTRLLPKPFHDHKQPYYKWLRDNAGVRKGQEGANLHLLPDDQLESYNTMDAILTLMLYQRITEEFAGKYDWTYDHSLHIKACERIVKAKSRGIKVIPELLADNIKTVRAETDGINREFYAKHLKAITEIEADRWQAWITQPKTDKGRAKRSEQPMPDSLRFNPKSTAQLAELFIDKLNVKPVFFTKESKASQAKRKLNPEMAPFQPKPSMKAAHLPSYGEGGEMLATYKKRLLVLKQEEKLLELSAKDGRWHHDLKACGTKTGRYAGGGGLNIQGLARRDKGLMSCLVPAEGNTFVSIDLAAGEPVVIAHYSQDRRYRAMLFDMVGKAPYWDGDVLMIDDPYLSFASISPIGSKTIKDAWDAGLFSRWGNDSDAVKADLKKVRSLHKTLFLALSYGQGPKGMVNFARDQGVSLDLHTAKATHHSFWNLLFPGVLSLSERLQVQFKRQGFLLNAFGFRMVPEHERLCLNMLIQSSVSGVMKVFEDLLFDTANYAHYISTVHDEVLAEVPDDKLDQFKSDVLLATDKLNQFLGWSVNVKTGFAPGKDLYAAK